jgi:DnaJ-class molecular chaperone
MLKASTHAGLECVACHTKATAPHDEKLPPVQCSGCHPAARAALASGAHRAVKGPRGAPGPGCAACHGTHDVRRAASLSPETCVGCHARQVGQYRDSIHGRARQRGDADAATCASCHGAAHTLVGKTDPRAPTYHLNLPRTCAQCHADSALARRHNIAVGNVYQLYMDSIHGRAVTKSGLLVAANCSDCHGSHGIKPRTDPASRVAHANVPATCGGCHAGVLEAYAKSVHGRAQAAGRPGAPVCTDCHSAHQIRRVEAAPWQLEAIRECGTCHEESLKTYRDTFHGKVTTLGFTRVAKCADCHGSHGILPAADPSSTVSTTRIVSTCRQCHTGATFSFTEFHPHADPHDRARFPKLYWVYVLMTGLLIGTFGFFGVHTVLWLPRSLVERLRRRGEG